MSFSWGVRRQFDSIREFLGNFLQLWLSKFSLFGWFVSLALLGRYLSDKHGNEKYCLAKRITIAV